MRRNAAWNGSRSAGSARSARPVMPGAWLHDAGEDQAHAAAAARLTCAASGGSEQSELGFHTPATFSSIAVVIA